MQIWSFQFHNSSCLTLLHCLWNKAYSDLANRASWNYFFNLTRTSLFIATSFQVLVQIFLSWQMPTYSNLSANVTFSVKLSPVFYTEVIASSRFFCCALFTSPFRGDSTLTWGSFSFYCLFWGFAHFDNPLQRMDTKY